MARYTANPGQDAIAEIRFSESNPGSHSLIVKTEDGTDLLNIPNLGSIPNTCLTDTSWATALDNYTSSSNFRHVVIKKNNGKTNEFTILSYFENLTSSNLPLQIALKNTAGGEVISEGTFSPVYDHRFVGVMGTIDTLVCLKKDIANPMDVENNLLIT